MSVAYDSLLLACDSLDANRLGAALEALERAVAAAPADPLVGLAAAQLRFLAGDTAGAFEGLEAAAGLGPRAAALSRDLRAACHASVGHWREALALLEQACHAQPTAVAVFAHAADLYLRLNEPELALPYATRAGELSPQAADWPLMQARALARLGRLDDAFRALERAVALAPDDAELRDRGAEVLLAEGDPDRAAQLVAPTGSAATGARIAIARGDPAGAEALAAQLTGLEARQALGAAALLRGDWGAAVRLLEPVLQQRPEELDTLLRLSEALMRVGRFDAAVTLAERARLLSHEDFSANLVRMVARLSAGRDSDAEHPATREELGQGLERLLPGATSELGPDAARARAMLLRALERLGGNRCPAVACYEHGRTTPLGRIESPRGAARVGHWRFPVLGFAEALEAVDAVISRHPGSSQPWCYRGELHLWVGDTAAARADFEQAISIYQRTRWAYVGLLAVETFEGRLAQADAIIEKGAQLTGLEGRNSVYAYRGELRLGQGRPVEAVKLFEAGLELAPTRVSSYALLCLSHDALGDAAAAERWFGRFRAAAPACASDAARAAGLSAARLLTAPDRPVREAVCRQALTLMRGNRSSACPTYFVGAQVRGIIPPRRPDFAFGLRERLVRLSQRAT
ncbi:MAG: tetratricopeptide repeat protein [Archangiaceae bacterium]|nr:tetratricopeptide repeat protein [Archangiaceae bacterium]